ncbi:MAG: GTP 3',8-cyclase MoaA [Elusimicrobia bacterium]|nr:GTP 3',8-cyclase MoaA [Elusimicrobiota bacterium]
MRDRYGRVVTYLRVSVTDRCNLRCAYCLPPEGAAFERPEDLLTAAELTRAVAVARSLGVDKVRLTGGEPLVRRDLPDLVARLAALDLADLSLSTNGVLLAPLARTLKDAGLRRVNVSLDTLDAARFRRITRSGELSAALAGIDAALDAGLGPVKVNVVAARGLNDDEVPAFVELTRRRPLHVRFIELMPIGETGFFGPERWRPMAEVMADCGPLTPCAGPRGFGPARYFRPAGGGAGTVGFIAALSCGFCDGCNRMRLSAAGRVVPCLASERGTDLRGALRAGAADAELAALWRRAAAEKPEKHEMTASVPRERFMCSLGG